VNTMLYWPQMIRHTFSCSEGNCSCGLTLRRNWPLRLSNLRMIGRAAAMIGREVGRRIEMVVGCSVIS
jgi:hypothetical protein